MTCKQVTTGTYTCQAMGVTGSICSFDDQCAVGLKCIGDLGSSYCGPLSTQGGTCGDSLDCADGLFCNGNYCSPPISVGSDCDLDSPCVFGSGCSLTTNTCQLGGSAGSLCSYDFECMGRCDGGACVDLCKGL